MANNISVTKKPSIKIYYNKKQIDELKFKEIMLGIEEENVPYEVLGICEGDVINLGYNACNDSILGVGIGINKDFIILHYNKLEKDRPLFTIKTSSEKSIMRTLGQNAARLVIKKHFKEF